MKWKPVAVSPLENETIVDMDAGSRRRGKRQMGGGLRPGPASPCAGLWSRSRCTAQGEPRLDGRELASPCSCRGERLSQSFLMCSLVKHLNLHPHFYRNFPVLCSKPQFSDASICSREPWGSPCPPGSCSQGLTGSSGDSIRSSQLGGRDQPRWTGG